MILITEINDQDIECITEAKEDGTKNHYIQGVFMQGDLKNRNGRIYPMETLRKEVSRYDEEYIKHNRAYGELGHPQGPTINLDRVSHMIKELREEGKNFVGKAKILDTPMGKIVKSLIDEKCKLGVSSRGMGSLQSKNGANYVQADFMLATGGDVVADPSAPAAFVEGIMEGVTWNLVNSTWVPEYIETTKKTIRKTSKGDLNEAFEKAFVRYLKKIGA